MSMNDLERERRAIPGLTNKQKEVMKTGLSHLSLDVLGANNFGLISETVDEAVAEIVEYAHGFLTERHQGIVDYSGTDPVDFLYDLGDTLMILGIRNESGQAQGFSEHFTYLAEQLENLTSEDSLASSTR